jgi:uncharacterized protein
MRTGDDALVIHEATGFRARLLGLAFRRELPAGHALLIPRCRSVHTFGMRYRIDVAFLDEGGAVLRLDRAVPRRRVLVCRGASAVLEASAGGLAGLRGLPSPV